MQKKRAILIGIFSGMAVLFSGFIIMYMMWEVIGNPQGLRGFFFYRAATIGDGICLPILVGSAVAFNWYNKGGVQSRQKDKYVNVFGGIVDCCHHTGILVDTG